MNIKPIRSDDDLAGALARVQRLWGAELAVLIEKYEDEHYPMPCSAGTQLR